MSLTDFKDKEIGKVRISKPIVHKNRQFETASWWQEETTDIGIFPVILREDYYQRGTFHAWAVVPATVTDAFFPSSFGGVMFGSDNKASHMGLRTTVRVSLPLHEAIKHSGSSPDPKGNDWWIQPELLEPSIEHYENKVRQAYEQIDHFWDEYQTNPDRIDMVGYMGKLMRDNAEIVRELRTLLRYRREGFLEDCMAENSKWATEAGLEVAS